MGLPKGKDLVFFAIFQIRGGRGHCRGIREMLNLNTFHPCSIKETDMVYVGLLVGNAQKKLLKFRTVVLLRVLDIPIELRRVEYQQKVRNILGKNSFELGCYNCITLLLLSLKKEGSLMFKGLFIGREQYEKQDNQGHNKIQSPLGYGYKVFSM